MKSHWLLFFLATAMCTASETIRPSTEVKVALVQCSSDLGAVEANTRKLTGLVEEAATNGAKIIVLPETAITGYLSQDLKTNWCLPGRPLEDGFTSKDPRLFAEPVPGPSTKHFSMLAGRLCVYLTIPFMECEGEGESLRLFNTVCLASPQGKIVAHYRKLTPWPHPEKSWATPGDRGVQAFDTEYGRVGLAICYDIHTILAKYASHHLWALLYPIAWVDANSPAEWFLKKLPARVAPYHCHLLGANWSVDHEQSWWGYGFSTVISANGTVLATAKTRHGSEIVYATLPAVPGPR